jgi:CDP-diacylglycerol---glycerol-3-phosphate 3-phosphatidyltransferase
MGQGHALQMSLAHYFTFLRILISPAFPILYLGYEWFGIPFNALPYVLLALLCISEFSDLIDGIVARKRNQVTDLGKVLDPMADSITHISILLTFTQGVVNLPLLLVLVFLYREFFISTLRTLCALRGVALAARFSGKIKAVMQAGVLFLILLLMVPYTWGQLSLSWLQNISLFATILCALYTMGSALDYLFANWMHIRKALYHSD